MDRHGGGGGGERAATTPRQPPWDAPLVAALPAGKFKLNEQWAWARIANGLDADMAVYPGDDVAPDSAGWLEGVDYKEDAAPDPQKPESFAAQHTLSELFLRTVLFHEPWACAPERPDVRIFRALIAEPLHWSARETQSGLNFFRCRFAGDVTWVRLHVRGVLSLEGSVLAGALDCDRAQIDSSLYCRNGFSAEKDITLLRTRIRYAADFTGATLKGKLVADGLTVGGGLFCDGLNAEQDIRLLGARIGGQASFSNATLKGVLQADGLAVEGECFLREMKRLGAANLIRVQVGGNLQLRGEIDGAIDLTGARIEGELQLDQGTTLPTWSENARLILRNASCGALAARLGAFRRERSRKTPRRADFVDMDLTGFRYERLGGLNAGPKDTLAGADAPALCAWLEAGRGDGHDKKKRAFNPGPYRQLAATLDASGDSEKARKILRAMAAHEHDAAKGWHAFGFFFSWLFIDYGFSSLRAILWFLTLVLGGAALGLYLNGLLPLDLSSAGIAEFFRWLGFSLGNAVPLISFDKAHESFLAARFGDGADPASTPVLIAWFFYAQKALGFVILTFLAAGLSGFARGRVAKG